MALKLYQLVISDIKEKFDQEILIDTITRLVKKFKETDNILPEKRQYTPNESLESRVVSLITEDDTLTLRVMANRLDTNPERVRTILRKKGYKACKPIETQKLTARQKNLRLDFCSTLPSKNIGFKHVWFSDEKIFQMTKRANHQNTRRWCLERPTFFNQNVAHPVSVYAWCGLSAVGIIGPFFFEKSVDQFEYKRMIDFEFIPALRSYGGPAGFWFQQDGATCHCTDYSLELLKVYFDNRIIRI